MTTEMTSNRKKKQRTILVAGIVDSNYEVSTSFAAGLLRFQQKMAVSPSAPKVSVEFFSTTDDALKHAEGSALRDAARPRVVLVDASMGIDPEFLLGDHPDDAITVAAYPLRKVRWEAVDPSNAGRSYPDDAFVYNFEEHMVSHTPSNDCVVTDTARILMPCTWPVQAKIVSIPLALLPRFRRQYDRTTHHMACNKDMIDITAECTNCGPYDFSGCVATHLLTKDQLQQHTAVAGEE
jgi:hypothetical protein